MPGLIIQNMGDGNRKGFVGTVEHILFLVQLLALSRHGLFIGRFQKGKLVFGKHQFGVLVGLRVISRHQSKAGFNIF